MVRVRFAPSPTGVLHIGGVRTALYNYLFSKKNGGKFILRIEDTDQKRYVKESEEYILEALAWCGISPDESPSKGGNYGPYRQSERNSLYQQHIQILIDKGLAYYAFDSPQELEAMRARLQESKASIQQYSASNRMEMKNSLTMDKNKVSELINNNTPFVIRIKVEENIFVEVNDVIRGNISFNTSTLEDKILVKSDGFPTYHLANIIDDHLMKITHVIRGEEWLPSTPLHALLYQYFEWEPPTFAHLPLLLKPNGKGKLNKRDADILGIPIFPLNYKNIKSGVLMAGFKEKGYLPEAVINFLALLGWNPGTKQEIFSLKELSEIFDLNRINKAGAKFDIQKANWLNAHYLKCTPTKELAKWLSQKSQQEGLECSLQKATDIINLLIERSVLKNDLWENGQYFFVRPSEYDEKTVRKKWNNEAIEVLTLFSTYILLLKDPTAEVIKQQLEKATSKLNVSLSKIMPSLRLALTGKSGGPDLIAILIVLGVEESSKRIEIAIKKLADTV